MPITAKVSVGERRKR